MPSWSCGFSSVNCRLVADCGEWTGWPTLRVRFVCICWTLFQTSVCEFRDAAIFRFLLGSCSLEIEKHELLSLPRGAERPFSTHRAARGTRVACGGTS